MKEKSVSLVLIALGSATLAWSATRVDWASAATLRFLLVFIVLTVPLLWWRVQLANTESLTREYDMEDVAIYASIFTVGPEASPHWAVGAWSLFLASLLIESYRLYKGVRLRGGWYRIRKDRIFYNFTNPFAKVVPLAASGLVYGALNAGQPFLGSWQNLLAIAGTLAAYVVVNILIDLSDTMVRVGVVYGRWDIYATLYLSIAMLAPLGVILTLFWQTRQSALLLLIVPVLVMHTSMKAARSVLDEAQMAIETMATALEERDQYTSGHSERVARVAGAIARCMGLPTEEVERIELAGRIHDLGKIDIPDAILRKPAGLTDSEFAIMKTHTDRTKDYYEKYSLLGRRIPFGIAAFHHERYDGGGYGYGLAGEQIPMGARILAVADTWDAMTTDRPYRRGLPIEEAFKRVRAGAGTQFDPRVVVAFTRALEQGSVGEVVEEWKESECKRRPPGAPRKGSPS